jgi:hypothetical protein
MYEGRNVYWYAFKCDSKEYCIFLPLLCSSFFLSAGEWHGKPRDFWTDFTLLGFSSSLSLR